VTDGRTGNRTLAAIARAEADRAARHRRAWLCLAVLLDGARTVGGARAALSEIPEAYRDLAAELLGQLAEDQSQAR
jgi:hypothetical protein